MTKSTEEFINIIEKSSNILITMSTDASCDDFSSAFGLYHLLDSLKKEVSFFYNQNIPQKLSFLEKPKKIEAELSGARDFIINFSTKHNKIIDVKTKEGAQDFVIQITPEKGSIHPKDFSFIPANFKYDLIIIIGASSLEKLGDIYFKNTDLFFEVPKANIDTHSNNENYGQVNLVDTTASSNAEILAEIILAKYEKNLNKEIAQSFLTGIVAATGSFQKPNTTPQTMITAAQLMKYEADQATVIRYLYKTKSLSFLKLWGRTMTRLNWNKKNQLIWSLLSTEDFVQSRSSEEDVSFVLEEIKKNFSQGQIYGIFYNNSQSKTLALIHLNNEKKAQLLAETFSLPPSQDLLIDFGKNNLVEAEKIFLEKLNQK